jgi:hypothetical protein
VETQTQTVLHVNSGSGPDYQMYIMLGWAPTPVALQRFDWIKGWIKSATLFNPVDKIPIDLFNIF